jgi:hypothetical protein
MPDADDPEHDTIRKEALWGNLMAGGAGVEWYFGYNYPHGDLNCEDWRSRDIMWDQTRYALQFFQTHLPFTRMQNHDELINQGFCLAEPGSIYALYLPDGAGITLDLRGEQDTYSILWYDPRHGGSLTEGSIPFIRGGKSISIGDPPNHPEKDWAVVIRAASQ